ncbi:hypothetical protein [Brachybacterium sp. AOP3-A1-3]|uniref:hypothetical protein n=1 Tax=Brachybacterium sp. AOP3-A1-3 TaxID=3457699 RepID=UPI004033EFE6
MRTVSGPRNRLVLVLAALVALVAAVWLAAASFGLADRWPGAEAVLPHADSTPASLIAAHQAWVLPAAVVLTLLAVVIGIWLLVAQAPSRPATAPLRFSDEDSAALGTLEPAVLERALSEHVEGLSGVLDASVQVSGSTTSPWVQASVTISEDAETGWAAQSVRELLAADVRTVLGVEARQVDLLVHLRSSAAPSKAVVSARDRGASARQEAPAGSGMAPA